MTLSFSDICLAVIALSLALAFLFGFDVVSR